MQRNTSLRAQATIPAAEDDRGTFCILTAGYFVDVRSLTRVSFRSSLRVSVFAGLDHWTGLLDWTTGLMNNVILM